MVSELVFDAVDRIALNSEKYTNFNDFPVEGINNLKQLKIHACNKVKLLHKVHQKAYVYVCSEALVSFVYT